MLRSRWPATAGLVLIVAVVSAVVLTFAAGARRTSSAPDRYTAAIGGAFDGLIYQDHGRPRTAEIAALPGASSAVSITFVFGGLTKGNADVDALVFAGTYDANGRRLVSGRAPASRNEFVASRSFGEETHASFGDTFDLVTLTQEQADATGFDTPNPGGPRLSATFVGIVDGPSALDDPSAITIFPLSLLDDPHVGVSATLTSVGFAPGVDLDTFRTRLDSLPDSAVFSLQPAEVVSSSVRKAVKAQALGLWALAGVAALAAVAEAIATRCGGSTASTGLRFAFTRRERDGGSMRTVVIGLLLTVGALVGAITFAASLDRLVSQPARYGTNYDLQFGNGSESVSPKLRESLDADADVAGLMLYAPGQARVGPVTLRLVGMDLVRGDIAPKVLSGRLPTGRDELALGRLAAGAFGVGVGAEPSLDG